MEILPKLKDVLEAGNPLRSAGLTEAEVFSLRSFSFWSVKPELLSSTLPKIILRWPTLCCEAKLTEPVMGICCKIEAEWPVSILPIKKNFWLLWGLPNLHLAGSSGGHFLCWDVFPILHPGKMK